MGEARDAAQGQPSRTKNDLVQNINSIDVEGACSGLTGVPGAGTDHAAQVLS